MKMPEKFRLEACPMFTVGYVNWRAKLPLLGHLYGYALIYEACML